ncbi:uncharacterized protein N7482_002723 [Penicillium canariense]|uniref:Uncharacterized protein n=1 Tax=Penicillium canariense TaxID=189055 RepID=A0A9W9IM95_9EURO|nr:uncharacterized protein N7482_002723 [Penicillium canariense]KAJ5176846.1 hypothetical protein N7482_002723 [Penicillium canariense]
MRSLVTRELSEAPENLALGYFMHVYAPTAAFEYLSEVSSIYLTKEPLGDALLAPSLLLFSQNLRLPTVQSLAQTHYAKALRSTNSALSSPGLAEDNGTLLAVLLLSLYEALDFQGRKVPSNWNAHTQGASELLRLRGEGQFDNPLGRHLFRHASSNIRTHCAQLGVNTPSVLGTLENGYLEMIYPSEPSRRFGQVVDSIANLRANIHKLSPIGHLRKVLELDLELEDVLNSLRRDAPFEVIDITAMPGRIFTYKNQIHQYLSPRIARMWNMLRIARLFLIQMVYHAVALKRPPEQLTNEEHIRVHKLTTVISTKMISEILQSVPSALELSLNPMMSSRSLIYPLSGIAVFEFASPDATEYAIDRLAFIGRQYGFAQAVDSTNMVLQNHDFENW